MFFLPFLVKGPQSAFGLRFIIPIRLSLRFSVCPWNAFLLSDVSSLSFFLAHMPLPPSTVLPPPHCNFPSKASFPLAGRLLRQVPHLLCNDFLTGAFPFALPRFTLSSFLAFFSLTPLNQLCQALPSLRFKVSVLASSVCLRFSISRTRMS